MANTINTNGLPDEVCLLAFCSHTSRRYRGLILVFSLVMPQGASITVNAPDAHGRILLMLLAK